MRNTGLEDLHSEIFPSSMIGDYSDVKVVSPFGEIPWTGLSRISNEEMKVLMIEVVDRVFTYLSYPEEVARPLGGAARWNRPRLNADLMKTVQRPLQLAAPVPEPAPQNPKSI
ncbi:hypothetical protein [Brevundimonas sp.]|uniref:hypothetical protein n=1 Tax=Brevundimonas sp. TaxID=1871086 RepID=UPI0025B98FF1|nr:hypothetical protein [Brevundimonas sp.]